MSAQEWFFTGRYCRVCALKVYAQASDGRLVLTSCDCSKYMVETSS